MTRFAPILCVPFAAGCVGTQQPADPCEPTYLEARSGLPDKEREARCAEQQQAQVRAVIEASKQPIDHALAACRARDDSACAERLRDQQVWSEVVNGAAHIRDQEAVLQSACRGGHESACGIIAEVERSRTERPDPTATATVLAASQRVAQLGDRWVSQLETLSKTRCATAEEDTIVAAWEKGRSKREKTVADLRIEADESAAEAGDAFVIMVRNSFDFQALRLEVALERALACEELIDDQAETQRRFAEQTADAALGLE